MANKDGRHISTSFHCPEIKFKNPGYRCHRFVLSKPFGGVILSILVQFMVYIHRSSLHVLSIYVPLRVGGESLIVVQDAVAETNYLIVSRKKNQDITWRQIKVTVLKCPNVTHTVKSGCDTCNTLLNKQLWFSNPDELRISPSQVVEQM